jgi:hypothetical protein
VSALWVLLGTLVLGELCTQDDLCNVGGDVHCEWMTPPPKCTRVVHHDAETGEAFDYECLDGKVTQRAPSRWRAI